MIFMENGIIGSYSIKDTIFADDNAILSLLYILESGKQEFFFALYPNDKCIMRATICRLHDSRYQLDFVIPESFVDEINIDDFFCKPAILFIPAPTGSNVSNISIFISQNDVESVSLSIAENAPRKATVIIKAFRADSEDNKWNDSKQTALFRFNPQDFNPNHNRGVIYDMTTNINQQHSFKNAVKIGFGKTTYIFYHEIISEDLGFFIIKSPNKVCHEDFVNVVDSIRSAYALLNGYYIADSVFYVSMKPGRKETLTFKYQSLNNTINSRKPLIDFHHYTNLEDKKILLTSENFESLVRLLYNNVELRRACILITQAECLDNISKGILASVALETATSHFVSKETYKPIKLIEDKNIIRQLTYELKKAIKKIKDKVDKVTWDKLSSKIGKFNELPNAIKLSTPFTSLGINLSEGEEYCLSCRNLFLHGSIPSPKEDAYKYLSQEELQSLIANRLCMLSAMLMLKKANYIGLLIDWGATEIVYKREIAAGRGTKHLSFQHRDISMQEGEE